jgi:hypothetical protein
MSDQQPIGIKENPSAPSLEQLVDLGRWDGNHINPLR